MIPTSHKINRRLSLLVITAILVVSIPWLAYILQNSGLQLSKDQSLKEMAAYSLVVVLAFIIILVSCVKIVRGVIAQKKIAELDLNKVRDVLVVKEERYRNLVENSGLVMFTTSLDGIFTFVSQKAVELTGYSLDELKGMHFSWLISPETKEEVARTYIKQFEENIEETSINFSINTKDGRTKYLEQSAVLIKSNNKPIGLQCIARDISERKDMDDVLKKYEMLLIQNQDRLQSILDNATSMIYIKDLSGKYLLINKRFKEVFKLTDDDVIGKTDYEITNMDQAQRFSESDDQVIRTALAFELEEVIEVGDSKHTILITKFPLVDAQHKIYGISGIATDITERVHYQSQLIEARKIAENAKIMQEQFLANMSHEIRTPMNGIQGMTDLLLETPLNAEQRDFAKTIKKSSDNLLVIINDILDFSKIKAGKLTIEKIDFTLDEVLSNIKATFKHRVIEKGIELKIEVADNVPAILNGDPYRLNQILINLTGNAVKFTSEGNVLICIEAIKNLSDVILQFTVSDTGIGIEADKIGQIFESFTQASIETTRKYGGTGLGLSITKQLLDLQGGQIKVLSDPNQGTTFIFSLPYNYCITDTPPLFAGKHVAKYEGLLHGKSFLVAEDNLVNQKVICHVLRKAGGTVDVANNGLEAIAFLNESKTYNLIIMDLQMPKMDGYAATKYIRNVMNISTPIIAMTASALNGQKELCLEIGMNDYVSKPFDFANIYKRICLLIEGQDDQEARPDKSEGDTDLLFDLTMLEELNDDEYLCDILNMFLDNTGKEISEMKIAYLNGARNELHRLAHKLKSSTGLFKIDAMSKILAAIEANARDKDLRSLKKMIYNLEVEYKNVQNPLRAHLESLRANLMIQN